MTLNATAILIDLAVIALTFIVIWRPSLFFRLLALLLRCTFMRVRTEGREHMPRRGPVLLVANHVAFFDSLMILAATPRRVRFMVHEDFFKYPVLRFFFWYLGMLKVPSSRHPRSMRRFLEEVKSALRRGEALCVFAEGAVSDNGLLGQFRTGVREMLPGDVEVPVIPVRLGLLWGRLFTFHGGRLRFIAPPRLPIIVNVSLGSPVSPDLDAFQLRQVISLLGAEAEMKPFPGELPLHAEFARRVRFRPRWKTFKDFGATDLADFPLLVRSLILSRRIRKLDPGPADGYIGVLLPNSTALVATLLGVMYADRSPAVLNYTAGPVALRLALEKSEAKLILTSRKFLEKLKMEELPGRVCLEDVAAGIAKKEKMLTVLAAALLPWRWLLRCYAPRSRGDLERVAVLLFSSGSSGNPKGVMLTHRNINCDIFSFWRAINWSREDRIIGSLPLFHAFGFTVCFGFPLISGTKSVMLANILDAGQVAKLLREEGITLMITTPSFLQMYMRKATAGDLKTLRLVITGAEKLRCDIARDFHNLTGLAIIEGYGCTELSPIVSVNLSASFMALGKTIGKTDSVGAPMPGIHVTIVDPETLTELPPNRSGLLLVRGGNVMKGYLKDPELTAKVLAGGYYNTGDIAAMSPDGYLTITGRLSRFSKIAGEMVPHELVERAIAELLESEGRAVAVTGKADPSRGEKLLVFHEIELEPKGIIEGLRAKNLPNLWIPKAEDFIRIEHLPLLGSGKLDLQHLKRLADEIK
ncbi:MAG: AMP-binding protein [Victivallaceae bacterium]